MLDCIRYRTGIEETNDWRIVSGSYVHKSGAQSKPVAELTYCLRGKKMRPGRTEVLLFVILICAFSRNDVVCIKSLAGVLPARSDVVGRPWVPI